jgi:hypothetical protein
VSHREEAATTDAASTYGALHCVGSNESPFFDVHFSTGRSTVLVKINRHRCNAAPVGKFDEISCFSQFVPFSVGARTTGNEAPLEPSPQCKQRRKQRFSCLGRKY